MKVKEDSLMSLVRSGFYYIGGKGTSHNGNLLSLDLVSTQCSTQDEVVSQAKIICEDYIQEKLKGEGLLKKTLNLNNETKSQVSLCILCVGEELEKRHPKVYRDLSRKLNMTMSSKEIVEKTLTKILLQLFEGEITWAKIISMFALAGQFAIECVSQGHAEFVKVVIESIEQFVSSRLAAWIVAQKGWAGVIHAFRRKQESSSLRVFTIVGTVVGLMATLIATLRVK